MLLEIRFLARDCLPGRQATPYPAEVQPSLSTVEVDQWFWSLFSIDKPVLLKSSVVKDYAESLSRMILFFPVGCFLIQKGR